METIKKRLGYLEEAFDRLEEALNLAEKERHNELYYVHLRNSVIKSFEFTLDLLWKCMKDYLAFNNGIEVASPKKVFRECLDVSFISEDEYSSLRDMIDDRNETSHVYDEGSAEEIAGNILQYRSLIAKLKDRLIQSSSKKFL